jgi:hypothetical protein
MKTSTPPRFSEWLLHARAARHPHLKNNKYYRLYQNTRLSVAFFKHHGVTEKTRHPIPFFFVLFDSHGYQLDPHRGIFSISNRKCHIVAPPSRDAKKHYPLKLADIFFLEIVQYGYHSKALEAGDLIMLFFSKTSNRK